MAHFAKIGPDNIVITVLVGRDEDEDKELELSERTGDTYRRTSYNTQGGVHYTNGVPSEDQSKAFRKNFAGIGHIWDEERDAFYPPQPYPSWTLNEDSCIWEAPVPQPAPKEGVYHMWDEDTLSWKEVQIPEPPPQP